jgi:hypothetical protein
MFQSTISLSYRNVKGFTLKRLKPLLLVLCCGAWGLLSYLLNLQVITLLSFSDQKFWLRFNLDSSIFLSFFVWIFFFLSIEPLFSNFWRGSWTVFRSEVNSNLKFKSRNYVSNLVKGSNYKGSPCRRTHPIRLYEYPERYVNYATCGIFSQT